MPKVKPSKMGASSREELKSERKIKDEKFQEFQDERIEGYGRNWRFDAIGHDTADAQYEFFGKNSNYDELIRNADATTKDALELWTQGHFMHGQQYQGFSKMSYGDKVITRALDRLIDQATLNAGLTVKRIATAELILGGGNVGSRDYSGSLMSRLQSMVGAYVISKGHMSTAAAKEGLPISYPEFDNKAVEYTIRFPKGSKGAGMWIGDKRVNDWGSAQREFIVNRDTAYRVDKVSYDQKKKRYSVELMYTGLTKHDYD